jgi:phosphoribosylcarboxyaminoimidazole (NCAIR) mutase
MNYDAYLLSLSISDFRKVKKAIRLLLSVGVNADNALAVIIEAHRTRRERYSDYPVRAVSK